MDPALLTLIGVICLGIFFVLSILFLPQRKLPEEHGINCIHTERSSTKWRAMRRALVAGSSLPARIAFYDEFFVVAGITLVKFDYNEIKSSSFKNGWLFNSATINFKNGQSLLFHPKNIAKIKELVKT